MPYPNTKSLPQAVKDKLKGKKRRQWMHVWNSEYQRHGDESRAFASAWSTAQKGLTMTQDFNLFLPLTKVERQKDGSVTVSGYASTPTLDLDNEIVSLDAVKKALPGYWEWRNVREMHQPSAVGVGKEAHVDNRGLFLTARITDPVAAQKCLDEVYKGFSIGGKKLAKTGNTITEIELVEVSVVDRPANPECRIEVAKRYKDRKAETGGYLVKRASSRSPSARALSKMAQAVEILAKDGPPAAHDGFSLPAKKMDLSVRKEDDQASPTEKNGPCKVHGIEDCPNCAENDPYETEKRDVGQSERENLASQGKALPGGGFPIKNKEDLSNARQAFGRAKNKAATRKLIVRRARELGVKLPDKWSKKLAKRLIGKAEKKTKKAFKKGSDSALPSFLTLSADDGRGAIEGLEKFGHELPIGLELRTPSQKDGLEKSQPFFLNLNVKDQDMPKEQDQLTKVLEGLSKAGRMPSRMQRLGIARAQMKKARGSMKECRAALKAAHAMHKTAYLSKMAKAAKKPAEPDADDFDHESAMKYLQKAYGQLSTLKTFVKAADMNIKKAASGRVGQKGQEVGDADPPFYEVPPGIKDHEPSDLSTASPGGGPAGSPPALYSLDTRYPGKAAKKSYSSDEVEALSRAAAAEAKVEILEKMPAAPTAGRKPHLFDTTKLALGNGSDSTSLFKDVNPNALTSDDEEIRKSAVGRVIGNMIVNGHGRNVFDPSFHGTAGAKS